MNISRKIILKSLLTGILIGVLFYLLDLFYFMYRINHPDYLVINYIPPVIKWSFLPRQPEQTYKTEWSKLPSPPKEIIKILSISFQSGQLQAKNGTVYECETNTPSCALIENPEDIYFCRQSSITPEQPLQPGQIIDGCRFVVMESPYTWFLLLYEDNGLWFGERTILVTQYRSIVDLLPSFCVGGLGFILGLIILLIHVRFQQRTTIPKQTS